jgi:hypothetical protein
MMPRVNRRLALLLALGACVFPAVAHANGDPASDVLPSSNVYLSVTDPKSSGSGRDLLALTTDAAKQKYPIKVAVIAQPADLGLIQSLWRKPQKYANFLGRELIAFARYHGTLVVSMPAGFGVFGPGATAAGKRALDTLGPPGGSSLDDLGTATADAVRKVAAANGHTVVGAGAGGSSFPTWAIVVVAAAALAVAAGAFFGLRRWLVRP